MSVGYVCDAIPAYLPHELLGFKRNSLEGMLLTFEIVGKINQEKADQMNDKTGQKSRFRKFKSLR